MVNQCSGYSGRCKFLTGVDFLEDGTKKLGKLQISAVAQTILQLLPNNDDFLDSFSLQKFQ